MRRIRVSIAGLLAGIALVGVTLAALIHPSRLWGSLYYSLTIATLLIVVLGAIYGRGASRAFRVGFATCGWAYFLAIWGPQPISELESDLITTGILDILYPLTLPAVEPQPPAAGTTPVMPGGSGRVRKPGRVQMNLREGTTTVLVGAFGGGGPAASPPTALELWTEPDRGTNMYGRPVSPMFHRVGHCIFCMIFALVGGVMTRQFQKERERSQSPPEPAVTG